MRRLAGGPLCSLIAGWTAALVCSAVSTTAANAQTAPETLRINIVPSTPAIRSITIDKKYKPIISRDDDGVVVDTLGSAKQLPPCETRLEVTLQNSRILHRTVNICTGNMLTVDVATEEKPGKARVIEGVAGPATTPDKTGGAGTGVLEASRSNKPLFVPENNDLQPAGNGSQDIARLPDNPSASVNPDLSKNDVTGNSLPALGTEGLGQPGSGLNGDAPDTRAAPVLQEQVLVTPSEDRVWTATPGSGPGSPSTLVHGVPETDDADFFATCQTQSGNAVIVFSQTSPTTQEGYGQTVYASGGTFTAIYDAVGSSTNNQYGQSFPQVTIPMTDPIWEAMIRESEITIGIEGVPDYSVSLKGSAQQVRLFVATCGQPQQVVSDNGIPVEGVADAGSDAACSEVGFIRSVEGVRPGQIVFRNTGREPVDVNWIDYSGGERPYARLQPGQILEQQTYVSHAWIVRGATGMCRGIYVSQSPYREVVIGGTAGNVVQQPSQPSFGLPDQGLPPGPIPPGNVGGGNGFDARPQASASGSINYLCTAGVDLQVTLSPDGQTATVAEMGYGVFTLNRQGGGSGFNYASNGHVLKGQIQNATWSRPGLLDVFCARR